MCYRCMATSCNGDVCPLTWWYIDLTLKTVIMVTVINPKTCKIIVQKSHQEN